jgi:hypothetical protein
VLRREEELLSKEEERLHQDKMKHLRWAGRGGRAGIHTAQFV